MLAALVARRIVPEPYASAGAAVAGLSPPAVAHATALYPELAAGALLTGAALCAVGGAFERPRAAPAFGAAAMLAVLPWLDPRCLVPRPGRRGALSSAAAGGAAALGMVAVELVGASSSSTDAQRAAVRRADAVVGAPVGGVRPGASSVAEYLERAPRLVALWLDPGAGLLRWAPVFALVRSPPGCCGARAVRGSRA